MNYYFNIKVLKTCLPKVDNQVKLSQYFCLYTLQVSTTTLVFLIVMTWGALINQALTFPPAHHACTVNILLGVLFSISQDHNMGCRYLDLY